MNELPFHIWRLVCGALVAAELAAITQIVTKDSLSTPLFAAVVCFAVSVPLLVAFFFYPPSFRRETAKLDWSYLSYHFAFLAAFVAALGGFASMFFSFGYAPGFGFLASVAISLWAARKGSAASAQKSGYL